MTDLNNVYQSTQVDYEPEGADEMELASPGKRIAAYLINCLIGAVAYIPMIWGARKPFGCRHQQQIAISRD